MDNPYEPPSSFSHHSSEPISSLHSWLDDVAWGYPALLISLMHGTWGLAWLQLGHPPEVWVDWPSKMGALINVPYNLAQGLMLISPAGALCGVWIQFFVPGRNWVLRLAFAAALTGLWVLIAFYWHRDPLQVTFWFWD